MPFGNLLRSSPAALLVVLLGALSANAADQQVMRLLATGQCPRCDLRGADLVHANLQGANLQGAQLQGANLSRANLSGANLRGADLRQASFVGADLSGSQLRDVRVDGTDLREADLQGAQVTPEALRMSNREAAKNLPAGALTASELHNQGSSAYEAGQFVVAESKFSEAIKLEPNVAQSWVARSLARGRLGNLKGVKDDLSYALQLSKQAGNTEGIVQIEKALKQLDQEMNPKNNSGQMNNITAAASGLFKVIAPLALKAMSYGLF